MDPVRITLKFSSGVLVLLFMYYTYNRISLF